MPRPKRRTVAGPVADLEALKSECAAAAAGGDGRAVGLLHQVDSWLAMLRSAGGDREIGDLFGIFAAEGRARMEEWWTTPT